MCIYSNRHTVTADLRNWKLYHLHTELRSCSFIGLSSLYHFQLCELFFFIEFPVFVNIQYVTVRGNLWWVTNRIFIHCCTTLSGINSVSVVFMLKILRCIQKKKKKKANEREMLDTSCSQYLQLCLCRGRTDLSKMLQKLTV